MIKAVVQLENTSPYSQSAPVEEKKKDKESHDDFEKRSWRNRLHVDAEGHVFIPPMAFKNCLSEAAKYLKKQIPGEGKATYTKHFEAGVLVVEGLTLPTKAADVEGEWLFLPSDGIRGSGKRVWKCYPRIAKWSGAVTFLILDEKITEDVFQYHISEAGNFIGIGRFRPRNNGFYGRFKVNSVRWEQQ